MASRQLWKQCQGQQEFIKKQGQALLGAQKAIEDLQTAQMTIEEERATFLQELQTEKNRAQQEILDLLQKMAAIEENRQAREAEMMKEIESIKVSLFKIIIAVG